MRTKERTINGKKCLMTFSVATEVLAKERGLDLRNGFKKIDGGEIENYDLIKVIECSVRSGSEYARLTGLGDYCVISADELSVVLSYEEIKSIMEDFAELVKGARNVDAEPPKNIKNASTTQAE